MVNVTDHPNMTSAVNHGRLERNQTNKSNFDFDHFCDILVMSTSDQVM